MVEMIELASYHYSFVRNLTISISRRTKIIVELVEFRYTSYCLSIRYYIATLEEVVQILVELVELTLVHSKT